MSCDNDGLTMQQIRGLLGVSGKDPSVQRVMDWLKIRPCGSRYITDTQRTVAVYPAGEIGRIREKLKQYKRMRENAGNTIAAFNKAA